MIVLSGMRLHLSTTETWSGLLSGMQMIVLSGMRLHLSTTETWSGLPRGTTFIKQSLHVADECLRTRHSLVLGPLWVARRPSPGCEKPATSLEGLGKITGEC